MVKKSWIWLGVGLIGLVLSTAGACQCGPPVNPSETPQEEIRLDDNGKPINPPDCCTGSKDVPPKDEQVGCPASWTVTMKVDPKDTKLYAVFCPAPTISGCQSLEEGKECVVADTPLIRFLSNGTTFEVEHSASIEDNSHGKLVPAPDATKPDRITDLPKGTKITALFSGISISFQLDGDKVTVFAPK